VELEIVNAKIVAPASELVLIHWWHIIDIDLSQTRASQIQQTTQNLPYFIKKKEILTFSKLKCKFMWKISAVFFEAFAPT
jgi:hypothetical protein